MALIRWSPFGEMDQFFDEDDWGTVPSVFSKEAFSAPRMNIYEENENIVAEAELPNVDPDNVDISIEEDVLTISGRAEQEKKEEDKRYFKREIRRGKFSRRFALPQPIKAEEASASYEDGVLEITMPKQEPRKGEKVEVDID